MFKAIKTPTKTSIKHELKLDEKSADKLRVTEESDAISRAAYIGQETPTKGGIVRELKLDPEKLAAKTVTQTYDEHLEDVIIEGTAGDDPELRGEDNGAKHFFYGRAGDDTFYATRGVDEFHGHEEDEDNGGDTVIYEDSPSAVEVDLSLDSDNPNGRGKGGYAQGDQYYHIENVTGSAFADKLTGTDPRYGDPGRNVLDGGGGDDELDGRGGDDILRGGADNDTLSGGDGEDELFGGTGDDTLVGGADADHLDGGEEEEIDGDTASYEGSDAAVQVNLAMGTATGGHAQGDTLVEIENLTGSDYADVLIGDLNDNELRGGKEDDSLYGKAGGDTLIGGTGDDTLFGGEGEDELFGGEGDDTLEGGDGRDHLDGGTGDRDEADYSDSFFAVTVDLSGTSSGGTAQGDTYSEVEDARGSSKGDTFYGTSADNHFFGEKGDDTFYGDEGADEYYGGDDNDTFYGHEGADEFHGGEGVDTADYTGSNARVRVDLEGANGQVGSSFGQTQFGWSNSGVSTSNGRVIADYAAGTGQGGHAQGDQLFSIENLNGSTHNGNQLYGSSADNVINSYGKDDVIDGRGGDDTITAHSSLALEIKGGSGNDTIHVHDDENTASWEEFEFVPTPVDGASISGGADVDTVKFHRTSWVNVETGQLADISGVKVNLGDVLVNGVGSNTYEIEGYHPNPTEGYSYHRVEGSIDEVENISGTQYEDLIYGDEDDNTFWGGGSSDTLMGFGGNDTLHGGAGADFLDGGEGINTASYEGSNATEVDGELVGVKVNLQTGTVSLGHAEGDTLENIQNLTGSNYRDILVGNSDANTLMGGAGRDTLDGGYGNDTLIGGEDADHFVFGANFADEGDHVTIADFQAGDKIDLTDLGPGFDFDDVLLNMSQQVAPGVANPDLSVPGLNTSQEGYNTVITIGDSTITLENAVASELSAEDFIFAT